MKRRFRHPTPEVLGALRRSPYFREMPAQKLEEMSRFFREDFFPGGSLLLEEKRPARRLFLLLQGAVAVSIRRGGEELIVEVHRKKGDLIGWSALVPPKQYTATAKALEDSRVLSIAGKDLEDFFRRHPSCGWLFLKKLSTLIATRLHRTRTFLAENLR
ncbi:MAG: cyclic nucleotide-binding domain-containing protein [Syntrophaceae bacterium]|nr:cyclic nucleotide-binding domain-containing protein [Syntrophaceae bacterium]